MTWFVNAANETEAAKTNVGLFLAASFAFSSGTLRFWTGLGEITLFGNVYTGVGQLGEISAPSEHVRFVAETKVYRLSGVDPLLASESDIDNSFGRSVTEYLGLLNLETWQPVANPEINWEGRIGSIRRIDGPEPLIEVTAQHRLCIIDQPDGWRYTHEHQAQFLTSDDGFKETPGIETKEVIWGGHRVVPGSGRGANVGGSRIPRRTN